MRKVEAYERENPGSDLKAPQPEGGSRKKSFCARMGGMKRNLLVPRLRMIQIQELIRHFVSGSVMKELKEMNMEIQLVALKSQRNRKQKILHQIHLTSNILLQQVKDILIYH